MNFNVIRVIRIIKATRAVISTCASRSINIPSLVGKHLKDKHNQRPTNLHEQFTTLKKCRGKFELYAEAEAEEPANRKAQS